jgi:predicted transcriptional regulator
MNVLMSIKPKWLNKILYEGKRWEVRKTRPKQNPPFTVYFYESGTGHVVGLARCHGIGGITRKEIPKLTDGEMAMLGMDKPTLHKYMGVKNSVYVWHLSLVEEIDPIPITEFAKRAPQSWCYTEATE